MIILDLADEERRWFFEYLRTKLESVVGNYEAFISACKDAQSLFDQKYPQVPMVTDVGHLLSLPVDHTALSLLPEKWRHTIPLKCVGDGNCLYR